MFTFWGFATRDAPSALLGANNYYAIVFGNKLFQVLVSKGTPSVNYSGTLYSSLCPCKVWLGCWRKIKCDVKTDLASWIWRLRNIPLGNFDCRCGVERSLLLADRLLMLGGLTALLWMQVKKKKKYENEGTIQSGRTKLWGGALMKSTCKNLRYFILPQLLSAKQVFIILLVCHVLHCNCFTKITPITILTLIELSVTWYAFFSNSITTASF